MQINVSLGKLGQRWEDPGEQPCCPEAAEQSLGLVAPHDQQSFIQKISFGMQE